MRWEVIEGDCRDVMAGMVERSVDAIVTDPPYGLLFMGKGWDGGVPGVDFWREALRVVKPGAHMLAFGGTRTFHRLACAIEDAGWEIRDTIMWVYGEGFPKSHDVSKAIEKKHGESKKWSGWGTALKPAWEPIIVARRPLEGTVADNVLKYGTGAINIDGCRVDEANDAPRDDIPGRWPANLIHDGSAEVLELFPDNVKGGTWTRPDGARYFNNNGKPTNYQMIGTDKTVGSAARYFYCSKANRRDRDDGLDGHNDHPTCKPTSLMRYLCRLVTPPNGLILDPFTGSGTTGKASMLEGFRFVGIEIDHEYCDIARKRIAHAVVEMTRRLSSVQGTMFDPRKDAQC